jgi:ubiquinone/menaquinone biosynthesis C-methylase UbiE
VGILRELSHVTHLNRSREAAIIYGWLEARTGERLLDLGCGDGFHSAQMKRLARQVIGVDISANEIRRAQAEHASQAVHFLGGNAGDLPFPKASFDRAVCLCALQNLPDVQAALSELGRVVRRGGMLGVSVDSLLAPPWVEAEYRQFHQTRHATSRQFDLPRLGEDFAVAGFEIVQSKYILRSRLAAFWLTQAEKYGWNVNYWFPISLPMTRLADVLTPVDRPGMILLALAQRL